MVSSIFYSFSKRVDVSVSGIYNRIVLMPVIRHSEASAPSKTTETITVCTSRHPGDKGDLFKSEIRYRNKAGGILMKELLSIALSFILMLTAVPVGTPSASAAVDAELSSTGSTGTTGECTWNVTGTSVNLELTIDGTGEMANYSTTNNAPWGSKITSVVISDGVTNIGDWAFYWQKNLSKVTIGNSVTSIGVGAFERCTSLNNLTIPDSVISISGSAFYNCTGINSIAFGNSVDSIGGSAFSFCEGLTAVTIPDSVTTIGESAFRYCKNLRSIVLGNSVTSIGDYAFMDCDKCTSVSIPESVTNIGEQAFGYYILHHGGGMSVLKVKDFTIYGALGSEAQRYANENDFSFIPISDTQSILGDANGDGEVTIIDATCIQRHLASFNVISFDEATSDATGDGKVTIIDATCIQRYLAGFSLPYDIGNPLR